MIPHADKWKFMINKTQSDQKNKGNQIFGVDDAPLDEVTPIPRKRGRPKKTDDNFGEVNGEAPPVEKPKPKGKGKGKGKGEGKSKMGQLHFALAQAFNNTLVNVLPVPETKLAVFADPKGEKRIIELLRDEDGVHRNICRDVGQKFVAGEILQYCYKHVAHIEDYNWTGSQAESAAKSWVYHTQPTEEPKPFAFRSDYTTRCYERLPFDLIADPWHILTPTFDEMFSRMQNRKAVMAFIGSLFVIASNRQQYVWLFGEGNDGKGSLFRFLMKVFGRAAQAQASLPDLKNKHWAVPYVGKRLITFPDFDDYLGMNKGIFKTLTGDDDVFIDPKNEPGYTASLICKSMFGSNGMPIISSRKCDVRRIILARMDTTEDFDPRYEEKLWDEGGAFCPNA